ncbi:hypothetical protein [Cylindrospermum sp. FACHB-282]|uniref:hypothetical protein n=1 Tax=Cylindrospermum sp. FACHB-282 TaxID=2692794 RepID=UPI001687EC01|nr:hypothetical protein [Cylindrospermum sp. FACHB-282]MBD2386046.1 hypothetical protein [Cylindrospermum sp. FACHB-282]
MKPNPYIDENALMETRRALKLHCHELIDLIFRNRYGIKLLLAASQCLETIADYKANRSGNCVQKFPLTTQEAEKLEAQINN